MEDLELVVETAAGLALLGAQEARGKRPPPARAALEAAIAHAKSLDGTKKDAAFRALEDLFRDDAAALELIRAAQK